MTLTPMQAKLLAIIRQSIEDGDEAPTFETMARAIGRRSKSTIMRLLGGLEERGAIRRLHHRHGAIEILDGSSAREHLAKALKALNGDSRPGHRLAAEFVQRAIAGLGDG